MKSEILFLAAVVGVLCSVTDGAVLRAWGEPHIWAYRQPRQVTCGYPGMQTYLDNEFMTITAYNYKQSSSSEWTVMTQIHITLKNPSDNSIMARYEGLDNTSPAPSQFVFPAGATSATAASTPVDHVVTVRRTGPEVVIRHNTARTVIVLGAKRRNIYLSMNVHMPDVLAEVSSGILIDGCPADHVVRPRREWGRPPLPVRALCGRSVRGSVTFRAACEFDAMAIDVSFAAAALRAVTQADETAEKEASDIEGNAEVTTPRPQTTEPRTRPTFGPITWPTLRPITRRTFRPITRPIETEHMEDFNPREW